MYRVSIEFWKHGWKFGRMRHAMTMRAQASVSIAFSGSPKLSRVFLFNNTTTSPSFLRADSQRGTAELTIARRNEGE